MTGNKGDEFLPTYKGFIYTTRDALIIIDQVLKNKMKYVTKRPTERDKMKYIKSGNVFVFIEQFSQMKRWTDGISWSASRMLGKFLIYKEIKSTDLENTTVTRRKSNEDLEDKIPVTAYELSGGDLLSSVYDKQVNSSEDNFKHFLKCSMDTSLIKKSFSVTVKEGKWSGHTIHLVSYYSYEDVFYQRLPIPSTDANVAGKNVSVELLRAISSFNGNKRSKQDQDNKDFMALLWNLKEDGFDEEEVSQYYAVSEDTEENDTSVQQAENSSAKSEDNRNNVSPPYWEVDPPLSRFSPSFHKTASFSKEPEFDMMNSVSIYESGLSVNYNTYHNNEIYEPQYCAEPINVQTFKQPEHQMKDTQVYAFYTDCKPHSYNTDTFMGTRYQDKKAHVVYTHYPIAAILEKKYNESLLENGSFLSDDSYPY